MNSPSSTAVAPDLGTAQLAERAARAAAALVPATTPLTVVAARDGDVPADAVAVVATLVGSPSADLVLVASDVLGDVTAAAGGTLTALDALRPALEAAGREVGAGVLEASRTEPAGAATGGAEVLALQDEGRTVAWFALRVRGQRTTPAPAAVPTQRGSMRMLYDVDMTLTAEIGRTTLPVRQVLDLTPGTVLELDRAAGAAADVMVNGRLIARGEVVVVDEAYGIRVTEIVYDEDAAR
ncbi:flagellar motor switch protein FliN [Cellulomonas rhizosphaerae]|uniref:Flagellar motor switch protein FliN n=1 Tax=Cellulomonas rhizosphaerae TaxID=2293719 RepID=A0A413RQC1_9CELL|nr:flagellar motor switch protein FliN [Cellulomonas rhizosphaerae]RHA44189.1 flagellar motor switch protein FliN [Cellulomonas rhizosphaerae]